MKRLKKLSTADLSRMREAKAENVKLLKDRLATGEATAAVVPHFEATIDALNKEIQAIDSELAAR